MDDLLVILATAALLTHEVDAGHHHEWRLLFVLRRMDDRRAQEVFTLLHLPLVALVLLALTDPPAWFVLGWDASLVVHVVLHERLRSHPRNTMTSPVSTALIWLAGLLAVADLVVRAR